MRLSKWESLEGLVCPRCHQSIPTQVDGEAKAGNIEHCLICGAKNLFRQKLFNRNVGVGIVVLGVIASFFVIPPILPLVVVGLIDLLLYIFLPFMIVCYACDAEHRGFPIPERLKQFDHLRATRAKKAPTYPGAE
jgi:hypothetical protein